jgi:hypothetical protein
MSDSAWALVAEDIKRLRGGDAVVESVIQRIEGIVTYGLPYDPPDPLGLAYANALRICECLKRADVGGLVYVDALDLAIALRRRMQP